MATQRLLLRVGVVQVYDARPQMATHSVTECDGGVTQQQETPICIGVLIMVWFETV